MPKLKLPPRGPVGEVENYSRVVAVNARLHEIGQKYRKQVPKEERTYLRWCQFLNDYEPLLVGSGVGDMAARYSAAPRE